MANGRMRDEECGRNLHRESSGRVLSRDHYTIGWICALPLELAAAHAMLDEIHEDIPNLFNDHNGYMFGAIGEHCVVIACLPSGVYGMTPAALVASQMQLSFPSIQYYLMVGIGGGVPTMADIRLGDVVVSTPTGTCPGVIQYDRGKTVAGGHFEQTGSLKGPPRGLLNVVSKLRAKQLMGNGILALLAAAKRLPTSFTRPRQEDILFRAQYDHICANTNTCDYCDTQEILIRSTRKTQDPVIHYGVIASGSQVMKHGGTRDFIAQKLNAYCFEMEAAGLADVIECLVVRGISDYCDSHKNKQWQGYAAATAAAYTKELLLNLPASQRPGVDAAGESNASQSSDADGIFNRYKILRLQTLSFPEMDYRLHSIELAHQSTCDWLFKTEQFLRWCSQHKLEEFNGVFWIKGKPGVGKSTIMKHILFYYQNDKDWDLSIAAYFFSAKGTVLQKSQIGMLRSLIYQLLDQDSRAYNCSLPFFRDKEKKHGKSWEWFERELEIFLRQLVVSSHKPVLLLIDALDECDEVEVQKIVSFLERLSSDAVRTAQRSLSICLSSRHYPIINMVKMLELIVEEKKEHDQDIAIYVQDQLRVNNKDIAFEIRRKADGVFMWVVLIVRMLNQAWYDGDIDAVWKKLGEIPDDLDEVFRTLLEKNNSDKPRTVLILQIMLFANDQGKISPTELYYTVQAGLNSKDWRQRLNPLKGITFVERFIVNSSRGLLEIRHDLSGEYVQFIHQTVKDFLLRNKRLQTLDTTLTPNLVGLSHQKIAACCLEFLNAYHEHVQWESSDSGSPISVSRPLDSFMVLKYPTKYIFYHAEQAQARGVGQEAFLQHLLSNPDLLRLILLEGICCDNLEYTWDWSLLYAISWGYYPHLARALLQLGDPRVNINARGGSYVTPLRAAVRRAVTTDVTEELVQVLLDAGADVNANGGHLFNALHTAVSDPLRLGDEEVSFRSACTIIPMLTKAGADVNAQDQEGEFGNVLQMAAAANRCSDGDPFWRHEIIRVLLDAGANVNAQGGEYGNALQAASCNIYDDASPGSS
ncbi:hypothetical protein EYR41_004733 [Orbilia oligospora]|uniref:Uncharacterized protein n=1 Tax=Orbilia oligospora TaxID=2813651 RepID=A0A7C8JWH9_ORBOL|nr:hypothetical protein TWF751_005511 [Orbilia oligospora]TGJ72871.1 hypothetical protein EYR41_004733 [Orbilia oligospora]